MAHWEKRTIALKPNHGWRCAPGHKLCVIGRGLMQFEYPDSWIAIPSDTSIKIHERKPPDDDMVYEASVLPLPPEIEKLPLSFFLQESILKNNQQFIEDADIGKVERPDLHLAWAEYRQMETDPKDNSRREAVWRHAFCQLDTVLGVITFGFWTEVLAKADVVWQHTIHSVRQWPVDDPSVGPRLH